MVLIGSSLAVYPAAGLIDFVPRDIPKYLIDPNDSNICEVANLTIIKEKAIKGVAELSKSLTKDIVSSIVP